MKNKLYESTSSSPKKLIANGRFICVGGLGGSSVRLSQLLNLTLFDAIRDMLDHAKRIWSYADHQEL